MIVYLDNCVIQRPLDDRSQVRIAIEAEAVLGIVNYIESGIVILKSSDVLIYEIGKIPNLTRKEYAKEFLDLATDIISINPQIEQRAQEFEASGIQAIDALHIASAEDGNVDYFCTTDDKFLKKLINSNVKIKFGNPIDLIEELEND